MLASMRSLTCCTHSCRTPASRPARIMPRYACFHQFLAEELNTMPGYAKLAATVQSLRIQPVYISTTSCQLMPQYCTLVSFPWPCCCVTFKCALHRRQTPNQTAMHPSTVSGLKACKHVPQVSGVTLVVDPATPHCSGCRMKLWCCSQKHAA